MSKTKPFSKINGLILLLVFGSTTLIVVASTVYQNWQNGLDSQPTFARLIRSEDKSFFKFHRYYFTCLYKDSTNELRFVSLVNSDLFHKKRVGDNIKVIMNSNKSFQIVDNHAKPVPYSILHLSIVLSICGLCLLIISFLPAQSPISKRDNE
ncbi:MAG: hypothetical protein H3C43_10410 [Leptonema sp. (in: Bacteria)]|nr:hypothetical protein [Leptonema sp. (in: bacteria)]